MNRKVLKLLFKDKYLEKLNLIRTFSKLLLQNDYTEELLTCYLLKNALIDCDNENTLKNKLESLTPNTDHHRDYRNVIDYVSNIFLNWLIEDILVFYLKTNNFSVKLVGNDADRTLLSGVHTSHTPDILINEILYIDIISNFPYKDQKSFWHSKRFLDLRDHKYEALKNYRAILLGIIILDCTYLWLDISQLPESRITRSVANEFGKKQSFRIYLNEDELNTKSITSFLTDQIKKTLEQGSSRISNTK